MVNGGRPARFRLILVLVFRALRRSTDTAGERCANRTPRRSMVAIAKPGISSAIDQAIMLARLGEISTPRFSVGWLRDGNVLHGSFIHRPSLP